MEGKLPTGFRFHPTDQELISSYLTRKVSDPSFSAKAIVEVDLNKFEPWDLPAKASMGEKEWYFFSTKDRKYPTGMRTNRATEAGYWKTTGKDKEIHCGGSCVGMKKTLVFYKGRAPKGEKSNWVMHEYRLDSSHPCEPVKEEWVVCRVFQKNATARSETNPNVNASFIFPEERSNRNNVNCMQKGVTGSHSSQDSGFAANNKALLKAIEMRNYQQQREEEGRLLSNLTNQLVGNLSTSTLRADFSFDLGSFW